VNTVVLNMQCLWLMRTTLTLTCGWVPYLVAGFVQKTYWCCQKCEFLLPLICSFVLAIETEEKLKVLTCMYKIFLHYISYYSWISDGLSSSCIATVQFRMFMFIYKQYMDFGIFKFSALFLLCSFVFLCKVYLSTYSCLSFLLKFSHNFDRQIIWKCICTRLHRQFWILFVPKHRSLTFCSNLNMVGCYEIVELWASF
jgi:hypothetical protein